MATAEGPFSVGNIDSNDAVSSFNLSPADDACLSIMDAVANACRLASDRELAAALLSNVEPAAVMATSWLANDVASLTGPADVAAAAWLDGTLLNASDDRVVGRTCSVTEDDFSATDTCNTQILNVQPASPALQVVLDVGFSYAGLDGVRSVCRPHG